ncbi:glycoside hydrolase [Crocosphaera sp. UHCC 0190]|uniref:glycoside hydrolase n=1 Tax=Crocosphaera sp. UHCC 0190 TaxID=3110246 RepID=UPI002B1E90D3|nr:glycoside hydrolase [Crocosphaera sp. UHCC 0190]MEA5511861.1 glycoside hydrolase [Crocosphaera sp. UHCC 0190]
MAHPLYVAFIWHQHQPLYKSREAIADPNGQYRMPWARLHGVKDYLDLVLVLEEYPQLHQTVNLVPSLILQLEDYSQGKAIDPYMALTLTPEEQLTQTQKQGIIKHFFDAHHRTLIDPHPRYAKLYEQRQEKGIRWCLENWTDRDYSDLLAWHNLAWIDPVFREKDPDIAAWFEQGKGFTLGDRQRIIAKHREIISQIIPQHKKMQDAGQLEVTTTPYTHPILPLLADTNAGLVAIPQMELPEKRFQYPQDIPRHLRKSREMYSDRFGREARGLWPSEQSVSPAILPYIAQAKFKWICSDEAVLGWSLKHFFHRDETGNVYEPKLIYRPYRLETLYGDISIVFRDHRLSDLIGFTYGGMDVHHAVSDLAGHLEAISRSLIEQQKGEETSLQEPWLVTIALDGENCWEYYQDDGLPFLRELYKRLSQDQDIKLVTVSEFLDRFPPTETIPAEKLHSGSWVDGSFSTWIGDPVKNKAWDLLTETRKMMAKHPEATEETNPNAWEALYAAEGSDWFWWFGEGHSSNDDALFDELFREHLRGVYHSLNEPVPPSFYQPLEDHRRKGDRRPQGFIQPIIDGYGDEQDWEKAGRIEIGGAMGTMHKASTVQRLFYGLDHLNFYLRFDLKTGVKPGKDLPNELHLLWYYADSPVYNSPAPIADLPDQAPLNYHFHHHVGINLITQSVWLQQAWHNHEWHPKNSRVEVAFNQCLELAVPWADLHREPDAWLHLIAVFADHGKFRSYLPENNLVSLQIP